MSFESRCKLTDHEEAGAQHYREYLEGRDEPFVEIVKLYQEGLMRFANSFLHDLHEAEDVVADTFFILAAKKPMFHGECSFKTWLYTIARNRALSVLRKKRRITPRVIMEAELRTESDYSASEWDDPIIDIRPNADILKAIATLKPAYGQALYLKYYEDFENSEIAHIMRRNKRQVENLLARGRKQLRTILSTSRTSASNEKGNTE